MSKPLIVITGASSGFGAEIAKIFNTAGFPMLLLARRTEMVAALPLNFDNVMIEKVDVTNYEQFETAVRKAEAVYGQTDLLVNNAGVMLLGNVETQAPAEWQQMLNVNIMGVLNGTQIVLNDMRAREGGTIMNMSSIAGRKAFGNHAAYVATKYGVHGLSETVRMENSGKNVRVMLLAPGAAETELLTHVTSDSALTDYEAWKDTVMGGQTLNAKHVAEIAKFMYDMPQEVTIREVDIAATSQDA